MIFQNIIKLLYMSLTNPLSQGVFWGFLYLKGGLYGFFSPSFSNLGKGLLYGFLTHILFWSVIYLLATPRSLKTIAWENKQKLFDIFYEATASLRIIFLLVVGSLFILLWIIPFIIFEMLECLRGYLIWFFMMWFAGMGVTWSDYKSLCVKFIAHMEKIN